MSRAEMIKITCPKCQKESDFRIWDSINTQLDPELKSAVRDLSLFVFECPECGEKNSINYGFLYHQMEDNMMIHYANSEENVQELLELYTNEENEMMKMMFDSGYLIRVVRSREVLLEKLAIFDAGLDDRIIEIIKLLYLVQLEERDNVDNVYFVKVGDERIIEFISDGRVLCHANLDQKFYSDIENDFIDKIPPINKGDIIIDFSWALECWKNNKGK